MTFDLALQLWYLVIFNIYFIIAMALEIYMIYKFSNPKIKVEDKEIIKVQKKIWSWPVYGPYLAWKKFKNWFADFCTKGMEM